MIRQYCYKCKGRGWHWEEVLEGFSPAGKAFMTIATLGIVPALEAVTARKVRCKACNNKIKNN